MPKKDDLYKIFYGFYKSLSESGIFPEEHETVDPIEEIRKVTKEIPKINRKLENYNKVLIGVILVLGIAFLSFVIDAMYFHISNSKYFENVYELKNEYQQRINDIESELSRIGTDFDKFKLDYPEFFR